MSEVFSTAEDGQTAVDIHVLQGERPMAADKMTLWRFRLEGSLRRRAVCPQIEVIFDVDTSGILHVSAKDLASGREQTVTITASTNLTSKDIERMVDEAKPHAAEDSRRRELTGTRNQSDSLGYQAEKAIRELGKKVPMADRSRIEEKIAELRKALQGEDTARIRSLADEVQQASCALSQKMDADRGRPAAWMALGRTVVMAGQSWGSSERHSPALFRLDLWMQARRQKVLAPCFLDLDRAFRRDTTRVTSGSPDSCPSTYGTIVTLTGEGLGATLRVSRGLIPSRPMKANSTPLPDVAESDAPGTTCRPLRVLIADDHKLIRLGLRMVLERDGLDVVGEAATGRQAVDMAKELSPDVVVVDIVMPDMDGFQALAAIRASVPAASIIMITAYTRPDFMARAIALGAGGYITKDDEPSSIPRAIRAVAEGEAIVNRKILQMALREIADSARSRPQTDALDRPSLTPQQLKVLSLIAEGMDNAAIASALSVSRNTVKTHVREIFLKLGVSDRTQAAIRALRLGIAG